MKTVLFDFGGVIADEGFRQGLLAIAQQRGIEREAFFRIAEDAVYSSGYVTGKATEADFWQEVRTRTGIAGTDAELSAEILDRFVPRPVMLETVAALRRQGFGVVMVSDQSDWLDRLNERHGFFALFDRIFNSFHVGKTKRDPTLFTDVLAALAIPAGEALLVDDNAGHIQRAGNLGLQTHLFQDTDSFLADLRARGMLPPGRP